MATVLIISSFVSSSRVGAMASAFCLRRLGHEAIVLPTTLMGRHPGWGAPGGGAVDALRLSEIWSGVKAQKIPFDAVICGYMGEQDHIPLVADILSELRACQPNLQILVDPVMGDAGRLYIPEGRAQAIVNTLVPMADLITPNLWEMEYLTGRSLQTAQDLSYDRPALITSVPDGDAIGAVYLDGATRLQVSHGRYDAVPHGGGDSLAGLFLAHRLSGATPKEALARSVASIHALMSVAVKADSGELPLIRAQDHLINAPALVVREI